MCRSNHSGTLVCRTVWLLNSTFSAANGSRWLFICGIYRLWASCTRKNRSCEARVLRRFDCKCDSRNLYLFSTFFNSGTVSVPQAFLVCRLGGFLTGCDGPVVDVFTINAKLLADNVNCSIRTHKNWRSEGCEGTAG